MDTFKKRSSARRILVWLLSAVMLIGNGTVFAEKEKPGAILVIQKKDGETVKGELLSVKYGMLTVLVYEYAQKMDFRLDEIATLRTAKKKRIGTSMLVGFLTGSAFGVTYGALAYEPYYIIFSAVHFSFIGMLMGLSFGMLTTLLDYKSIRLEGQGPEKLLEVEAQLRSLARYRAYMYSYWKFVFCGPSDETHVVIFTVTGDPGKFEFHGVDDHNGTFTDDGKVVVMALPGRPDTVCSGRFIDADHMAGTWESSGQTWTWTAVRTSWTAAVKETPVFESKLLNEKRD